AIKKPDDNHRAFLQFYDRLILYMPTITPAINRPSRPPNIAPDQGVLVAPQVGLAHSSCERLFI
ncbi:MAG: hypothetical protein KAI94_08225, partial [Anaerolineales bacterium]|nr:hypothetical protein [Anaerolineales bacterium]